MPAIDSISTAGATAPALFPAAIPVGRKGEATSKRGHVTSKVGRIVYGNRTVMDVPKEVQARLSRAGGRNRFNEPNYRIVWGPARMGWIGGRFEPESGFGLLHVGTHLAPKYPYDQWVLERWMSPEHYGSKEAWKENFTKRIDGVDVEILGPYPTRGDYEEITSFDPIALNQKVADYLVQVVERSRGFRHAERREAILRRENKKEQDWSNFADDVLDDCFSPFPEAHVALSS